MRPWQRSSAFPTSLKPSLRSCSEEFIERNFDEALLQRRSMTFPSRRRAVRGESLRQHGRTRRRTGSHPRPRKPPGHRKDRDQWVSSPTRREVQAVLGMRIRAMRKARGLPQDVLARRCGISPAILGQIERGHTDFRLMTVLSIASGLETTVSELFSGIA